MSLFVTLDEFNVPLMHKTYEGNISDVSHFKQALTLMEKRFKAIELELSKIMIVFDKGNNSEDAYKFLDSKRKIYIRGKLFSNKTLRLEQ